MIGPFKNRSRGFLFVLWMLRRCRGRYSMLSGGIGDGAELAMLREAKSA